MRPYLKIALMAILVSSFGCKSFQEQVLDDRHQIALEEPPEFGIQANKFKKGVVFGFDGPINMWWTSPPDKIQIRRVGDTLRIDMRDCGQKYECLGTEIGELLDFSQSPVLKVTARMEGNMVPLLGISLKDSDGNDTNMDRPSQRIQKHDGFQEYYFNYTGKWRQSWPDNQKVNPAAITDLLLFVNPGAMNWTGTIYIDKIEAITLEEMPSEEELKKRRRELMRKAREEKEKSEGGGASDTPSTPVAEPKADSEKKVESEEVAVAKKEEAVKEKSTTPPVPQQEPGGRGTEPGLPPQPPRAKEPAQYEDAETIEPESSTGIHVRKDANAVTIDDFSADINRWWASTNRIKVSKQGNAMVVDLESVGPAYEMFGRTFSRVDFFSTPVIKIRFKAEGDIPGELRVDVKDNEGFSTNAKPVVKKFKAGTDFVDYYYDFTGKFEQIYPAVRKVNPNNIIEILLSVNPGGEPYTGKLIIEDITAISVAELNKVKK